MSISLVSKARNKWLSRLVYNAIRLEDYTISCEQAMAIAEGSKDASPDFAETCVKNIRRTYKSMLSDIDSSITYELLCKFYEMLVADGVIDREYLNNKKVCDCDINTCIEIILSINDVSERAATMFDFLVQRKIFPLMNISLACIITNKILISCGYGIMDIPVDLMSETWESMKLDDKTVYKTSKVKEVLMHGCILNL